LRLAPAAVAVGLVLTLTTAQAVSAHAAKEVGEFHLEIGWLNEPALVGQPNAVQLAIRNHDETPVTDLGPDDLTVTISTGDENSAALPLTPAFDAEEGEGPLGEYHANLIPTAPGDYTFHFIGKIHDTAVDFSLASGDETFDPVVGSSDLEFPVKQPTLTEVGTRLDRIDGRIEELQAGDPGDRQAIAELQTAAASAQAAANQALLVGGAGVLLAIVSIVMSYRASRKAADAA
jgi:hypothetical protein